jgi:peptide/nickel transport system permease protein
MNFILKFSSIWQNSNLMFKIGFVILSIHLIIAMTGPFWAPFPYDQMGAGKPLVGMNWTNFFGTDHLGRDVFSRVVHGSYMVISLSVFGTMIGLVVGSFTGLLSAYIGGWVDEFVQRFNEALISIPFLVLGLLAILVAGPKLSGEPIIMALAVALVYAPRISRISRSAALDIIMSDYVLVARLRGESALSIIWREILPNISGTMLVEFAIRTGFAPILIGSFGFLGFGIRPPFPEWGSMINDYRPFIFISPITVIGPVIALSSLVVSLNLFTEGLARLLGTSRKEIK